MQNNTILDVILRHCRSRSRWYETSDTEGFAKAGTKGQPSKAGFAAGLKSRIGAFRHNDIDIHG